MEVTSEGAAEEVPRGAGKNGDGGESDSGDNGGAGKNGDGDDDGDDGDGGDGGDGGGDGGDGGDAHGTLVRTVDASGSILTVDAGPRGIWELGASRAGLREAEALLVRGLVRRRDDDDDDALHAALYAALREAAPTLVDGARDLEADIAAVRRTPLVYARAFHDAKYLRRDAERFRPCRIAIALVEQDGVDTDATPEGADALVERLCGWRDLFAVDGRARHALNTTLHVFGDQVDADALWGLRRVPLSRPAASALHVEVLGTLGNHPRAAHLAAHMALVEAADRAAIDDAIASTAQLRAAVAGGVSDGHGLAEVFAAVPNARGVSSLAALARLALDWASAELPPETKTALPPVPLPAAPGVRFLDTLGALYAEGRRMRHCVASRRIRALTGEAFLFHTTHEAKGLECTVEVNARGQIVEARGPHNKDNAAVAWARPILAAWGLTFPR